MMEAQRYLDGELPPARREAFEEHIRGCAECRELLDDMGGVRNLFSMAEQTEPLHGLTQRVLDAANGCTAAGRGGLFWADLGFASRRFVPAAAALSVVLAVAATFSTLQLMNSSAVTGSGATVSNANTNTTQAVSSQAKYLCFEFSSVEEKILKHDPEKEDYYSVFAVSGNAGGGTGYGKR